MNTRTAFLVRSRRILPILLSVVCFFASAEAQPGGGGGGGGGGGHSGGGGHFGGGHFSGGSHAGGHFGWLHFWSGKHSSRHGGSGASPTSVPLWNVATPSRIRSSLRIPPTFLWSPPLFPAHHGQISFVSSPLRSHRAFFFNRFPRFSSSGCFWNGVGQVCFFEPSWPLLCSFGGFDLFDSGFGGDWVDLGGGLASQGAVPSDISEIEPPPAKPLDDDGVEEGSTVRGEVTPGATEAQALGKGVFLLVLHNGTSHAVTDYWAADGYLEYISPDGTRSHIPLEALDLQNTVIRNAPHGLPFLLRSTPAQDR